MWAAIKKNAIIALIIKLPNLSLKQYYKLVTIQLYEIDSYIIGLKYYKYFY